MKVKALKSFIGKVSMSADEIKDIADEKLAKELIKVGYALEVKTAPAEKPVEKTEKPAEKKNNKKK